MRILTTERQCIECKSPTTTVTKTGSERWYKSGDGFKCHSCYLRTDWNKRVQKSE